MPRDDRFQWDPRLWGSIKPYVAMFLVTAVVTYAWVASRGRSVATQRGAIQAQVCVEPVSVLPSAETLRSQIANEENIARTLAENVPGMAVRDSIKRIRWGLQVTAQRGDSPRAVVVGLTLADPDSAFATRVVNALGEQYAEGCRIRLREEMRREHRVAAEALAEGRQHVQRAQADLEGFLARHFGEQERLAQRALSAAPPIAAPTPVAPPQATPALPPSAVLVRPNLVDNPDWMRLQEQVQARRRALFELLAVRTPLHPDVQAMQADISDLERRMMVVPRQVLRPIDETPVAQTPAVPAVAEPKPTNAAVVPGLPATEQLATAQTFTTLNTALRRALEEETRLAAAERTAWQAQYGVPSVKFLPATGAIHPSAMAGSGGGRVLWVALIAAMAVVSGVGMIVNRPGADPQIATVSEAEQALGVPVLGIVPVEDLPDEPLRDDNASPRKLLWMLGGVACILGAMLLVMSNA